MNINLKINRQTQQWCAFLAHSLGADSDVVELVVAHLANVRERHVVAAGIVVKRFSEADTNQMWVYLKPDFSAPSPDDITEAHAAMHCLSSNEVDILLLCHGLKYDASRVDEILGIDDAALQCNSALEHLHSLISFEENTPALVQRALTITVVENMLSQLVDFINEKCPSKTTFNHRLKKHILASIGIFALIDVIAIVSLIVIFTLFPIEKSTITGVTPMGVTPVYNLNSTNGGLFYRLTYLPPSFYKMAHTASPLVARAQYSNGTNQFVFTQQVSAKKVMDFSKTDDKFESLIINKHPARLFTDNEQLSLYWFNDFYAYTISGNISRDDIISVATGAKYAPPTLPYQYSRYLASENGDVLSHDITSQNVSDLNMFYDNFQKFGSGFIRIFEQTDTGVILKTIEATGGKLYLINDVSRNGGQELEQGVAYDELLLSNAADGKKILSLRNSGEQITIITY